MSAPLLQVSHVTACYGVLPVLHDVSLEIHPREIVALIGANGAGKTTLMMTVFGRPRPTKGHVLFEGRNITALPAHAIAQARHRPVPGRPANLPAHDGDGEFADGRPHRRQRRRLR